VCPPNVFRFVLLLSQSIMKSYISLSIIFLPYIQYKHKCLVLMVRFTDHTSRPMISKAEIDKFWQSKVPDWFDVNSQVRYVRNSIGMRLLSLFMLLQIPTFSFLAFSCGREFIILMPPSLTGGMRIIQVIHN